MKRHLRVVTGDDLESHPARVQLCQHRMDPGLDRVLKQQETDKAQSLLIRRRVSCLRLIPGARGHTQHTVALLTPARELTLDGVACLRIQRLKGLGVFSNQRAT